MRPLPVHVEDGGEVLRVLVKEVLRDLARHELLAELQHLVIIIVVIRLLLLLLLKHLVHTVRPHELAQPGGGESEGNNKILAIPELINTGSVSIKDEEISN